MNAKIRLESTPLIDFNTKEVWEYFVISTQWQDLEYFQISTQTTSEKYPFNKLQILAVWKTFKVLNTKVVWQYFVVSTQRQVSTQWQVSTKQRISKVPL